VPAWGMLRPALEDAPGTTAGDELADQLVAIGRGQGLAAVGITDAAVFSDTRQVLFDRKAAGLDGGMQFTYRNPERSTDPTRLLPGARSLVVGAWGYRRAEPPPTDGDHRTPPGRVAGYAWRDHYQSLRQALTPVADRLRADGWRAVVVCDDNALVDRAVAHRAGLGWFGKNTLLLLPGLGSWFVLGSVVTDAPLLAGPDQAAPVAAHGSGCGSCTRCIGACPTGALVAPGVLDANRCLAWLVQAPGSIPEEFRVALGDRLYGCDECQQACPINRMVDRHQPPVDAEADSRADVDLIELLDSSDDELLAAHGRWYIAGRQPRYLRRNALVALGNTGDGSDPATQRVLVGAATGPDPMLAEHAVWAARRLGRGDLVGEAG
jgi:epoxyqueuosine reductase